MSKNQILSLGTFEYDPTSKRLIDSEEQEARLRPQSLAVLSFLAQKPNEIISKDEIFAEVWKGVSVTDDSLVQCIADIRRTIGDSNHKILKTIPRRGYMLIAEVAPPQHEADHLQASGVSETPDNLFRPFALLAVTGVLIIALFAGAAWYIADTQPQLPEKSAYLQQPTNYSDIPTLALSLKAGTQQRLR